MKKLIIFLIFFLAIVLNGYSQGKYKRMYAIKENHFNHVAYYVTGNAIIIVDRDSLIERYNSVLKNSSYYESSKEKIKSITNTLLSAKSDTVNVTALVTEPDVINITFSYFSDCITNKRINIIDKRDGKIVKKIIVKKSQSKNSHSHSWYYYFLPNDREEFMHRVDRVTSKVKFL
jgi:hypothetical protein